MRTVVVTNMATLQKVEYVNDLPVEQIVLNAYMQMEKKDFSWWAYDERQHPPVEAGGDVVACGDWCAWVDGHRFQAS